MTTQEHALTSNRRRIALAAFACFASAACAGTDVPFIPGTGAEVDAIAAYEALSSQLETCENEQAACAAAAAGDPTELERCDFAAVSCNRMTEPSDARARDALDRSAHRCQDDADDAGVVDDEDDAGAGGGGGHGGRCIVRRIPDVPKCVRQLVGCLDDAGLRERSASREEILSCVQSAHACFRDELAKWRDWRREQAASNAGPTDDGSGGAGRAGSAGKSAADSGDGGRGGDRASAGRGGAGAGGRGDDAEPGGHASGGKAGRGGNAAAGGRGGAAGGGGDGGRGSARVDAGVDPDPDDDEDTDEDADEDTDDGDDGDDDDDEQEEEEEECDWSQHAPFARGGSGSNSGANYRNGGR